MHLMWSRHLWVLFIGFGFAPYLSIGDAMAQKEGYSPRKPHKVSIFETQMFALRKVSKRQNVALRPER